MTKGVTTLEILTGLNHVVYDNLCSYFCRAIDIPPRNFGYVPETRQSSLEAVAIGGTCMKSSMFSVVRLG